jgi:sulfate transport system substrate-binding protein
MPGWPVFVVAMPKTIIQATRRAAVAALLAAAFAPFAHAAGPSLLNVSYDVARELYKDINPAFQRSWKQQTGEDVTISQSHGGSSKQARAVIDGLEADVVTMNQSSDIDAIARARLIPEDWAKRLPNNAAPTTSVTVILVRKGNPKGIHDWPDLGRAGTSVVIPNPKITGNGRYTYVAAWGSAIKAGGTPAQARELVQKIFANVPVFDGGGRAATTTFAQRNIGDALCTFESEVNLIKAEFGDSFEVVYPKSTILAENPVAVIDKVVDKKKTRKEAEAYLKFLWSDEAQEIAAKHQLRPRSAPLLAKYAKDFPKVQTFTIDEIFGGWSKAQKEHFDDGGVYDQILAAKK